MFSSGDPVTRCSLLCRWPPALALAAMAALPPSASAQATGITSASRAVVRSVSRAPLPTGERITIELSREVPYSGERVADPDRVYFDFRGTLVASPIVAATRTIATGPLVSSVRIALNTSDTTRLVLDLAGSPRYSAFPMYDPFRLVIDVETAGTPGTTGTPGTVKAPGPSGAGVAPIPPVPPAALSRGGDYSIARQLGLGVARVVIDPGHGGHDPGAQSNGVTEAELVLDIALRLERLLKVQPGIDVVLTRRTDEFIPLEERTAIANREGADLFLSIHANASKRTAARGIETYFLNFATDPKAEAVAARENASSGRTMGKLTDLVRTITLNNKVLESRELATIVQTSMVRRLRQQNKALRDLGVKQAPFVVLIGAEMPSVLAEIAFVTNRAEATLLKQASYRQRVAQSLAEAVVTYQGTLKQATAVAANAEER
jgi:N-acetylmuramoyl-L-alanine amidase